jgi:hypothetical protein
VERKGVVDSEGRCDGSRAASSGSLRHPAAGGVLSRAHRFPRSSGRCQGSGSHLRVGAAEDFADGRE